MKRTKLTAPADTDCRAAYGVPCYSPQEMQTAYNIAPLINAGTNGAGQTIVIIDSFGSPTIASDLATFDSDYGLPAPPSFTVLSPLGTVPFDPNNSDMTGWAFETTLDVEWAHAMAPGANIVLLTSPVSETEGVQGMPNFLALEQYALDHHLGQVISQSWGATEETLTSPAGQQVVHQFESFYQRAASQNVTVLASAGDGGTANVNIAGQTYPNPTVIFPASSPWVTAVGGTSLTADTSGNYQSEVVWNDNSISVDAATGGGVSTLFSEPPYQHGLSSANQAILGGHRGLPDIAYNADPYTSILIYVSFIPGAANVGYYFIGGTSEGAPQWAGIVAVANQLAGHSLGFLNPSLYKVAGTPAYTSTLHDITVGNNANDGVTGFNASVGWDPTTGLGSPNAATLLPKLIAQH
jgi:subtilase family serine protease